jgi:hypothetical protein
LTKQIIAPSGKKVLARVTFGAEFFRPFFWLLRKLIRRVYLFIKTNRY